MPSKPSKPSKLIHPVILSGGSGTRLWPASRTCHPKQFLALINERSLLQNTMLRFAGERDFAKPVIVGSAEHRHLIAAQAQEHGIELGGIIIEPVARDTALAVAAAAHWHSSAGSDPLLLVMPADHVIEPPSTLLNAVRAATAAANEGWLVTFGVRPTTPETGYGYVEISDLPISAGVWRAKSFVEKPKRETAQRYLDEGRHFWNSGIFLFRASALLEQMRLHAGDVREAAAAAVSGARGNRDVIHLDRAPLEKARSISIDYALMQISDRVALMPVDGMGWSDVGSWDTLYEFAPHDDQGNAVIGEAVLADSENNLSYLMDGRLLVGLGVSDLVIISTPDALLVTRRDLSQKLKSVVDQLRIEHSDQVTKSQLMHRPWGHFESLHSGDRHNVRHVCVRPGGEMVLQRHFHRSKHWVVVKGTARVTRGNETVQLVENESIRVPAGVFYRLENPGRIPLSLIEVQSGPYLSEDDTERYDEHRGRASDLSPFAAAFDGGAIMARGRSGRVG